jgi:hypothetical protein
MSRRKVLLALFCILILLGAGGFLYYKHHAAGAAAYQTEAEADNLYVRFAMEAYDSILANYWMPHEQYDLPTIFELSFEKALGKEGVGLAHPTDRASTAAAVEAALKLATSTEAAKEATLNAVSIALYNLQPVARNGLMSQTQVTALRDEVSNKNPETGEIEPTIAAKVIGKTLYVPISRMSPTTLQEFADAVNAASTTPLDSFILDVRGNVGGALDLMPALLGLWIGQDQYAFDLYRQGEKNVIRTTQGKYAPLASLEAAVLVDGETQSTAELIADGFKRYRLGTLVGTTTRGWGTVENTYPLATELDASTTYALFLVNSLTVREDNQSIEANGVVPAIDSSKAGWQASLAKAFRSSSLIAALKEVTK